MDVETVADLIANITIISKTANFSIKDKRPGKYLKNYDDEILKTHLISLKPDYGGQRI